MKTFRVTLKHDNGKVRILTTASTEEQAINQVLNAERAPRGAVEKTEEVIYYTFIVSKDGEIKKTFERQETDLKLLGYMHRAQGQSLNHAIKHEGWKIEIINEETGEKTLMKPYA